MKRIVVAVLCLVTSYAFGQEAKIILEETFDNNFREWSLRDNDTYARNITGGKMLLVNRDNRYHWAGHSIIFDKKKNFRIETTLNVTKFKSGQTGIFWGGDEDYKKMCFFIISPDGTFQLGQWAPEFQSYTGSTKHAAINKGIGLNKVAMEKVGGKVKLFVNDVEVHTAKYNSGYGKHMGLFMGGGALTVEADYFKVTELPKE
jgi:hypothetical protein